MAEYPENVWIWDDPMNGGRGWDTEDRGCSKPYLRADTCTPNEKLEGLIREIEQEMMSQVGPNDYGDAVQTMGKFVIKRLREVMK